MPVASALLSRPVPPGARPAAAWPAVALGLLFFAGSAGLAVARHLTFHTRARDMGIYVQALWSAAQGRPFASTLLQENANHLAEHVAPALWPLVPLAGLAADAVPLLVLQQAFLAACGAPIYLAARARLGPGASLAVLAAFYLMPAVSRISLSEFHPVVLAALPVAAGLACILIGRPRAGALLLLLGLVFEEETAPLVAGGGALALLLDRRRARAVGPIAIAAAVVYLALALAVVMPGFRLRPPGGRGETANRAASHYDLVRQDPGLAWAWLSAERGPDALAWLILPTGGLALLAPEVVLAGLPGLLPLLLQDRPGTYAGHWSAPLQPLLWLAVAVGLGRLRGRLTWLGLGLLVVGGALAYRQQSYFPGGREFEWDNYEYGETEAALRQAVDRVPPQASLVATRRVVPHLAARRDLYQYPFSLYVPALRPEAQRQDVYILDLTDSLTRRALEPSEADSVLEKRPRYHVARPSPAVLVLGRSRPEPPVPLGQAFGGSLQLLGLGWGESAAPGEGLPPRVWLYWEALRRPEGEVTRVVRLVGPDARAVVELVGRPLDDYLPPRDWERGQVIAEQLSLRPAEPPGPGAYRLLVGWRAADGRPLPLDDGRPELELARFEQR